MKKLLLPLTAIVLILISQPVLSQRNVEDFDSIADNVLFRKELSGGIIIHSNGWGLEFRTGRNQSIFNKLMLEVNLAEMKDSKEIKSINPFYTNTRSYYYGKLNTVYIARAGVGHQRLLNRKPYTGGVELRLFYSGGISTALAKPVYLHIIKIDESTYRYITVTERYDPDEHFPDNIYGRASFLKGFNNITPYPGAYLKAGLNVEFGTINQRPKTLEAGIVFDAFVKPVPIMAFKDPDQFFLTLYLSFGIGKRYN
ncbi:MAG TPA: hypothetical protein PLV51_10320 [Lentimicrobium sp.]|jgi:hypothetical protein|nr:hypothetical protein [Lentimicrobium sp.]